MYLPDDFLETVAAVFSVPLFAIFAAIFIALGHGWIWLLLIPFGPIVFYILIAIIRKCFS